MQIYWSLKHIPELSGLSSKQRNRVYAACRRQYRNARITRRNIILYLSAVFLPSALLILAFPVFQVDKYSDAFGSMAFLMIGAISWLAWSRIEINQLRPHY